MTTLRAAALLVVTPGILFTLPSAAQDSGRPAATVESYQRAEALLASNLAPLIRNARIVPRWINKRDEFWYDRQTAGGHEFVVVDATTGRKRPAIDHAALARALDAARSAGGALKEGDAKLDGAKLPFHSLDFSEYPQALTAELKGKNYRCSVQPVSCTEKVKPEPHDGWLVSPDGNFAAFTKDGNLWVRDLKGGTEKALTSDGSADFGYGIYYGGWKAASIPREREGKALAPLESHWSPDSRYVIVPRVDQRDVAKYPWVENTPRDGSFRPKLHEARIPLVGEKPAEVDWFAIDATGGKVTRLDYPYAQLLFMQQDLMAIRKTWWKSDNSKLYAVAFGDNMESAFFFEADPATGKVRTVVEERAQPRMDLNSTSYNPPNVRVTADGENVIWFSQRDGWGHLYLYDGRTGELRNQITQGNWLVRDIVDVDEARRRIYFTAGGREPGNPYYRYLYRVDFDGKNLKLLSPEPGDHLITSPYNDVLAFDGAVGYSVVSPSGRYVVYTNSPLAGPSRSYIRGTADARQIAMFEESDAKAAFAAGFRSPEEFIVKSADGSSDLYGVMYKPLDFDPALKYPVIDAQYASPLTAVVPRNFLQSLSVPGYGSPASTAQLGFIVVVVDARGTTYRSREFTQANYGRLNIIGLDDHVATIRQLAARHSFIDVDRVGTTGASYGGWTAFRAMLEFPEFFKVGVAGVPPGSTQNMYLDYHWTAFHGRPRYADGTEWRTRPDEVAANWNAVDGRQQAARLKGKLLIIMGELDEHVLPGSTLQLMDAFIRENRDFDLLYQPDTNHYESGGSYVVRRMWDYFVRNLQGVEPPAEYRIGVKKKDAAASNAGTANE